MLKKKKVKGITSENPKVMEIRISGHSENL